MPTRDREATQHDVAGSGPTAAPAERPARMPARARAGLASVAVLVLAGLVGWVLSLATTRVVNWFVMTDELFYERLAISVAQTGSVLPRIHGEITSNVNQLYPLLTSLLYGTGNVPASLVAAHRLNAFVMASAAIPVYLLARRVGVGRLGSLWVAGLAVATPWMVLSSFLLTEAVAYPAFCWALLVLVIATLRKSTAWDLAAFAAIGLAVSARTQFVVLVVVLAAAVVTEAVLVSAAQGRRGRALLRSSAATILGERRLLLAAYAVGALGLVVVAIRGDAAGLLGSYSVTAEGIRIDLHLLRLAVEQWAILALATGVVPLLLGAAWLTDRLRPSAAAPERALACVGAWALVAIGLEVASFDQRFGADAVKDRYLFYVLPVALVALAAAIRARSRLPWWTWALPAAAAITGLALARLPVYEKLNVDTPAAILNDAILDLATSREWARVLLPLAAVVAIGAFLAAAASLPRLVAVGIVAGLVTVALPGGGVYAFHRLFAVDGTNGLPITLDQGVVFNWIDRTVGRDGRVAMLRYPVNSTDYWAGVAYWWDAEFWNESVVGDDSFLQGLPGDEPWTRAFDRRTGAARQPGSTRYVLVHGSDVRFRIAGRQVAFDRGAYIFEPETSWRADWVTDGIYPDGWSYPHTPVRIRVYAKPGQEGPLMRFLTVSIASPDPDAPRPLSITSNASRWHGWITPPETTVDRGVPVCVPPGSYAEVEIETPYVTDVYRDPTKGALTGERDRPAGILVRSIALADETEPVDACAA